MKSIVFLIISIVIIDSVKAQQILTSSDPINQSTYSNWCGTEIPDDTWNEAFNKAVDDYKNHLKVKGTNTFTNYMIPVVVHVIHGGQSIGTWPNISQAQINSQITVLNQDYSANGVGVTQYNNLLYSGNGPFYDYAQGNALPAPNNTSAGIIASNTGLQFCMALTDPLGNTLAEPGIDRVNYISKGFAGPTTIGSSSFNNYLDNTLKPAVIWDNTKYMNIFVSDRPSASGLLGFTTFPSASTLSGLSSGIGTATNDGIWIYGKSFGTTGTLISGYTGGQVCGHESGHYFGLRHPWGDGTCLTDYCNDTPPAYQANYNSNTTIQYPYTNSGGSCSGNFGDGEMYMNLMDYSLDVSKYMFTTDQAIRMQTAMQNSPYRKLLGTHGLCSGSTTNIYSHSLQQSVFVYPNPSNGIIFFKPNFLQETNLTIELYNILDERVFEQSVKNVNTQLLEINCTGLAKGVYIARVLSTSNEAFTKKIVIE